MGTLPEMRDHAPRFNVVIVSMNTGPSSWFAPTQINGKMFNFLMIVYLNLDLAYKTPQQNSVWLKEVLIKPLAYVIYQ